MQKSEKHDTKYITQLFIVQELKQDGRVSPSLTSAWNTYIRGLKIFTTLSKSVKVM